jgi:hypothetical protein
MILCSRPGCQTSAGCLCYTENIKAMDRAVPVIVRPGGFVEFPRPSQRRCSCTAVHSTGPCQTNPYP